MRATVIILLFAFGSIESRKILEISKNANVDFINMEAGGQGRQPAPTPSKPVQQQPSLPQVPPSTAKPQAPVPVTQAPRPVQPQQPQPNQGLPTQGRPNQGLATQMDLRHVQPGKPGVSSTTTPGPGNVRQLVTFYDSQGKASLIRPYSYSDAVKKGKA